MNEQAYGRYIDGMSNADYHDRIALGSTTLKRWLLSPLDALTPVEVTPAMRRGTIIHEALEDYDAFLQRYRPPMDASDFDDDEIAAKVAELPDDMTELREYAKGIGVSPARSKAETQQRIARCLIESQVPGETLDPDDYYAAVAAVEAVRAHPALSALLDGAKVVRERSYFWIDPRIGIACKCRPDVLVLDSGVVLDWKSTSDPTLAGFAKRAGNSLYHLSAAHYLDGVARVHGVDMSDLEFAFGVIPSSDPTRETVTLRPLTTESIERGLALRDRALDAVAAYRATVDAGQEPWKGYAAEPVELHVPTWADRI